MQEHFHLTTDRAKLQKQYAAILFFVSAQLSSIQIHLQRRNRHWLKQKDEVIITIHVLGKLLGFISERAWHQFVIGNLFPKALFPERSRYNHRYRALGFATKWIRHQLAKRGQTMRMRSWTACRSIGVIHPECIVPNGFVELPILAIVLRKRSLSMG